MFYIKSNFNCESQNLSEALRNKECINITLTHFNESVNLISFLF